MNFFEDFEDFEDEFPEDLEINEESTDDPEREDASDEAESQYDDFTSKDAFFIGGAMGFAYEEGLRKRKRNQWFVMALARFRKIMLSSITRLSQLKPLLLNLPIRTLLVR